MAKFPVAAGVALALVAGSALAADLPARKGPPAYIPPPPAFSWTGLYGGVNIGYGFGSNDRETGWGVSAIPGVGAAAGSQGINLNGVTGGGQVGYNYQFSPWLVLGFETDIQAADINSQSNAALPAATFVPLGAVATVNSAKYVDWWGTVRGRVGLTLPGWSNFMIYGTGGFAYGQVNHTVSSMLLVPGFGGVGGRNVSFNTATGWTAGGGVEWTPMAFPSWSVKVEYLYTDLGSTNIGIAGNLTNSPALAAFGNYVGSYTSPTRFHTVRAGLNWHFNPFASAPVLAKY